MCLVTTQKEPLIASKDITVYKSLSIGFRGIIKSQFERFIYELNKLYETTIEHSKDWTCYDNDAVDAIERKYPYWTKGIEKDLICLGDGFHSAATIERLHHGGSIFECVIPKDSEYYMDETGLVVSNKIIVVKQIEGI